MRHLSPENDAIELRSDQSSTTSTTTATPHRTLLVLASQHGDEPCGVHAVNRLFSQNHADPSWPFGEREGGPRCAFDVVRFVLGNPRAFALGQRQVDDNLNRCFPLEDSALAPSSSSSSYERERAAQVLAPLLREVDAVLDLHSASAPSPAFAMVPPSSSASVSLAECLLLAGGERKSAAEIRYVLKDHTGEGLGLAIEWSARHGRGGGGGGGGAKERVKKTAAVTVECGEHSDDSSVDIAALAIEAALAWRGEEDARSSSRSLHSRILVVRRGEVVREGFRWRWQEEEGEDDGGGGGGAEAERQPPPEAFKRFAPGQLVASDAVKGELRCDVEGGALIVLPAANPVLGEDAFLWGEEEEREGERERKKEAE